MSKSFSRSWTLYGSNKTLNVPGSTVVTPKQQTFVYSTTVSGGNNPGYKQQISRGINATTTLAVDAQDLQVRSGFAFASVSASPGFRTDWTVDTFITYPTPTFSVPAFNSSAEAKAVAALYRQIRAQHQQFYGGVFLGEIRQTVQLITSPLQSITKATTSYLSKARKVISSSKKSSRKGLRENLANEYLKWTFGVVPLMNDISDISQTIQRAIKDPPRVRFTASGESEVQDSNSVLAPVALIGNVYATRNDVVSTRSFVKYYGAFKAMTNEDAIKPRLSRIQELSGFTLRDFVPTVWNLIPYSFIADYFINIGDVLEALTTDTSGVAWLSRTQVTTRKHVHNVVPDFARSKASGTPLWVWKAFSGSSGGFTALRTTINRASATIPIMEFRSKIESRTGKKVLNLLALIAAKL